MNTGGEVVHAVDHLERFHRRGRVELELTILHDENLGTGGVNDQFFVIHATSSTRGSSVA